uniref:Rab-GAP TBC domain-containing protein n=1 Tax=Plectus sambesii TaxID=2011161 RepID=A0A914W9J3_9BILA
MLRIWDCFLLEGPKVLFRFALALLGVHELTLMERSDTISVIKLLKAAAKLTYDTDGLIKLAFEQLKPFPKRNELCAKQMCFLKIIKERLKQKEQLRDALTLTPGLSPTKFDRLPIEMLVFGEASIGFIASGHQKRGRLAVVDVFASRMRQQTLEFDCRVVAMVICKQEMAFVSLLSGYLVALAITEGGKCEQLWELKLVDVALQLIYNDNRLFAALANGSLAVLENAVDKSPIALELYYIPVGPAPLASATVINDQLWCAMGSKAVIMNIKTLDCVEHLCVAGSATGGGVSFFEKIICFHASAHGVWLTTAHSCLVQLWDSHTFTCRLLFDISADHSNNRKALLNNNSSYHSSDQDNSDVQITALLCHENSLWVGTADGYLVIYDVVRKNRVAASASANRYQAGQRVSPIDSTAKQLYTSTKEDAAGRIGTNQLRSTCGDSGYSGMSLDSGVTDRKLSEDGVVINRSNSIDNGGSLGQYFAASRHSSGDAKENDSKNRGSGTAACRLAVRRKQKLTRTKSAELPLTISIPSEISTSQTEPSSAIPATPNAPLYREGVFPDLEKSLGTVCVYAPAQLQFPPEFSIMPAPEDDIVISTLVNSIGAQSSEAIAQQLADKLTRQSSQVGEGVKKWRDPSFFQRLRSATSLSSVHSTMSDSYDYDDLFLLYKDADENEANGGLVSSDLARGVSDWNLPVGLPYPIDPTLLNATRAAAEKKFFRPRAQSETGAVKLRRKDLEFENFDNGELPPIGRHLMASESTSVLSLASSTVDPPFAYSLALQMKLKIADMPVKCLAVSKFEGRDIVVSCAGNYGDEESVLRWTKEDKTGLWINDPIVDLVAARERRPSSKFSFASISSSSLNNSSSKHID